MSRNAHNRHSNRQSHRIVEEYSDKPKIISKRYNVTTQTAYHIMELALQEGVTEGRIVDKIMRTYLATRKMHDFKQT